MQFLIDRFSPAELLHIVSIANKYQLLNTEQKRFLIALRMSNAHDGQAFQVDAEKKQKFCRIFSQFLQELQVEQCCEKPECPICERFQNLCQDFHGKQSSQEFSLFMEWFQSSTRKYGVTEKPASVEPKPITVSAVASASPMVAATSITADRSALQDSYSPSCSIPAHEKAITELAENLGNPVAETVPLYPRFPDYQTIEPLFTLNDSHPLVRMLSAMLQTDTDNLPEKALRSYTDKLQGLCARLLVSLTLPVADANQSEINDSVVTAG